MIEFRTFNKIARLSRDMVITEKIDGTNGLIYVGAMGEFLVGSRNRWITPEDDNAGFARWAYANKDDLLKLGEGYHYGEWWGQGIQRGYNLKEKRFSLFNVNRWTLSDARPMCCGVVPTLYVGLFDSEIIQMVLQSLKEHGSYAAPGFTNPEGIVIYHTAAGVMFKKTIQNDEKPKGQVE